MSAISDRVRRSVGALAAVVAMAACGSDAPSPAPRAQRPSPRAQAGGFVSTEVLSFARVFHTATLLFDGRVLVAGGSPSIMPTRAPLDGVELFDPASATFRATSSTGAELRMKHARDRHTATLLDDGTVLLAGGRDAAGQAISSAERFDPRTATSVLVGGMTNARLAHTATKLADGTVLIVGGSVGDEAALMRLATAEIFDPATNSFSALPAVMEEARGTHTATTLPDGRVLLWGGNGLEILPKPEIYDPATRSFSRASSGPAVATATVATLVPDGRVLVMGAVAKLNDGASTSSLSLWFDPTTGDVAPAPFPYGGPSGAVRLPDGRVLTVGDGPTGARVLDPASGSSESLPSVQRRLSSVTLLHDGRALVVGGLVETAAVATVEILDTAAAAFRPRSTRPMEERSSPVVQPLGLGKWLVATGSGSRTVELRDDAQRAFSWFPEALGAARISVVSCLLPGGDVWLTGGLSGTKPVATTERFSPATGLAAPSVTLAAERSSHTVTPLPDGRLLVAGGHQLEGCNCSSAELADPEGGSASSGLLAMTTFRQGHTATWLPSTGKVLIAGGDLLKKTAELFDPVTGAFTATAGPTASKRYLHTATTLKDGRVLLVGGGVKTAELYDPATGEFSATSNQPMASRHTHAAALLPDGRVLIAGGAEVSSVPSTPNMPLSSAELFDPTTDEFTPTGSLRFSAFEHHAVVRADGRVSVFANNFPVEVFDPATGAFTDDVSGAELPCAGQLAATRAWSCVVTETTEGRALVTGGVAATAGWLSPQGQPAAGPKLAVPRAGHTATVLFDGRVALVGGEGELDALTSIELVDPRTNESKEVGALAAARARHTTTRVADGRLVVLGGETKLGQVVPSLELLSDVGVPAGAEPIPTPRSRHAATLLADGRVLVVGGVADGRPVLAVEAFDARTHKWSAVGQANVGERPTVAHLQDGSVAFVGSGGAFLFRAGANEVVALATAPDTRLVTLPLGQVLGCRDGCRSLSPGLVWADAGPMTVAPTDGASALGSSSVVFAGNRQGAAWIGWSTTHPRDAVAPLLDAPGVTKIRVGDTLTLTGSRFTAGSSSAVAPGVPSVEGVAAVVLRPLDGVGPARTFEVKSLRSDRVEAVVPHTANFGPSWVYVVVDGVASQPRPLAVLPSLTGRACESPAECTSGFCADGVCCESACQEGCRACSTARRGAAGGPDGQCQPIEKDGAPRFGCEPSNANVCGPTGTCDGLGACSFPPRSTPCDAVPGGTCSNGVCTAPLTCTSHAECPPAQRCNTAGRCESASVAPDASDPGGCAAGGAPVERQAWAALCLLGAGISLARRRARWSSVMSLLAATAASPASAQPAAPAASSAPAVASSAPTAALDPKREEARALLRRGLALHEAGDVEKALDYFLRSKAVFAAKGNTLNAASSLRTLGRLDEALEQYEEALTAFGPTFDDDDKVAVPRAMAELRALLGVVRVSADVQGVVVVGGRARGTLPLSTGLRLMPGEHTLRVIKDGYKTFEARVSVRAGETIEIDAKLTPLAASGGLRVEVPGLDSAEVLVDGVRVGVAPWEGTLAPGPHVVAARLGVLGSAPFVATVLQGQTALVRAKAGRLSGRWRIVVDPPTADLSLDGVPLGKHEWQGQLPPGRYQLSASEPGYVPVARELLVADIDEGGPLSLSLAVDRAHPRWPKTPAGRARAELFSMMGIGTTFGSAANAACDGDACESRGLVSGPIGGVAGAFELPIGLSVEVAGGGLSLSQSQTRTVPRVGSQGVSYRLEDLQRVKGWWLGTGLGYRASLGARWSLRSRLLLGVLFARSSDTITGAARSNGSEERATVDGSGAVSASTPPFAFPQIGVARKLGDWEVGGAVALWVVLSRGPALEHGAIRVFPNCQSDPAAPGCVGDSSQLAKERSYGLFTVIAPQLSVGRAF